MPSVYAQSRLKEALFSITSTLHKCEKVVEKLKPGSSSHTLTSRRIAAFQIAIALIQKEMEGENTAEPTES